MPSLTTPLRGRADMASRIIRNTEDLDQMVKLLRGLKLPVTISWVKGADRSTEQNSLMWIWAGEVATQLQDREPADVQAEWKLVVGIPILRADDAGFCETYDATVKHLDYETKIKIMRDLDFPVTRLMKVSQMCRFMNEVQRRCLEDGLHLTEPPEDLNKYNQRYGRQT